MSAEGALVHRRLAAILAADITGYSALIAKDDVGTVQALKGHQAAILPLIESHSGRLIDTAGDGFLSEFASAVKAVECALAIQTIMGERNQAVPEDRRLQFRIGVNLGDVLHDGEKLFGDGVNIAARLEGLSEPGGICVSGKVKEEVGEKLQVRFVDLGPQTLKNIAQPVAVYRVARGPHAMLTKPVLALPDKPSIAVLPFTNGLPLIAIPGIKLESGR